MIKVDNSKCVKCAGCVGVCPLQALKYNDKIICDKEKCTSCGICVKFCPVGAIDIEKGDSK